MKLWVVTSAQKSLYTCLIDNLLNASGGKASLAFNLSHDGLNVLWVRHTVLKLVLSETVTRKCTTSSWFESGGVRLHSLDVHALSSNPH